MESESKYSADIFGEYSIPYEYGEDPFFLDY
jgi:hypothetical protein